MATLWRGMWIAAALFGCQTSNHHESLRYPEHRKVEEHRLDELEAVAPQLVARVGSLEQQVTALKNTVHDLERALAEQKAAVPPPASQP